MGDGDTQPLNTSELEAVSPDAAPESEQFAAGMTVGGVRLVRKLAEGGMGGVWIGRHDALDKTVAVKLVMSRAQRKSPHLAKRVAREAAALMKLDNPHIVKVYDHGVTASGSPYLVMELLEGMTLQELLKKAKTLPLSEVRKLVVQVADALNAAHEIGIVHRDIKPGNIFLLEGNEIHVKLVDFGIAKDQSPSEITNLTAPGMLIGTPQFMSPEQLLDPKNLDHRSDLWSLGAVAFTALTGEPPFLGDTLAQLFNAITVGPIPQCSSLCSVPAPVDTWFEKVLMRDPKKRFGSAIEMAKAFELAGTRQPPPRRKKKKNRSEIEDAPTVDAATDPEIAAGQSTEEHDKTQESRKSPSDAPPRKSEPPKVKVVGVPIRRVEKLLPYPQVLEQEQEAYEASIPPPAGEERAPKKDAALPFDRSKQLLALLGAVTIGAIVIFVSQSERETAPTTVHADMVSVAAGEFTMGCSGGDCDSDERPPHRVVLGAFAIERAEVTVGKFKACVEAKKCTREHASSGTACTWDKGDALPMNCVSWQEATAYCKWAGMRLPTEAEWERAARGKAGGSYPWGDAPATCEHAVMNEGESSCDVGAPREAGSKPDGAADNGAVDLAGNLWEWVGDWYEARYYTRTPIDDPTGPSEGTHRVIRGGGWLYGNPTTVRSTNRDRHPPADANTAIGFRCARSAP